MDKAKIGYCRVGHFRIGCVTNHWEQFQKGIEEKLSPRNMGGIDPALFGYCRLGYCRFTVKLPLFDEFIEGLEKHG